LGLEAYLQAAVLGLVEGITEYLPVSSTAHLLVVSRLLGFKQSLGGTFEVFIQLGGVLAVLGFYGRDLWNKALAVRTDPEARRFWIALGLAFLPAALAGVALRNVIKTVFFVSPMLIGWSLILGGIVLIAIERMPRREPAVTDPARIGFRRAFIVGLAQTLAIVPGVSRSGAAMVGGMLAGMSRPAATGFAFYLAVPTLGGAAVFELASSIGEAGAVDIPLLLFGLACATVSCAAAVAWLLRYVASHTFVPFGIYRIVAGLGVLSLAAAGIL
jgi:undecaprenyl-diphosphatase